MGFDNQLFSFVRDGQHEGMAITILGSRTPHQLGNQNPIRFVTIHETSQQTDRGGLKVEREATTRDRERVRRRYSRDLDVRYLSSLKSLKERLLSAYSCNQNQCPMIKERYIQHNQSIHGGRRCEKKCTLASSKSKNCVSIRAGPDFDEYSDQKCEDCPMPYTSSHNSKLNSSSRPGYNEGYSRSARGNLKYDKKYAEGSTSPFNNNFKVKNEYGPAKNRFDEYEGTSYSKNLSKNKNNVNDCCIVDKYRGNNKNTYGTANNNFESRAGASFNDNLRENRNNNGNNCCDPKRPEYSGNYKTTYGTAYNNFGSQADASNNNNLRENRNNNANSCCDPKHPEYSENNKNTYRTPNNNFESQAGTSFNNNLKENRNNNANSCCDPKQSEDSGNNKYTNGTDNNNFESQADASYKNDLKENRNNTSKSCCNPKVPEYGTNNNNTHVRSGRYADGYTTPYNTPYNLVNSTRYDQQNGCCNTSDRPGYTDNYTGCDAGYSNACNYTGCDTSYSNACNYNGCDTSYSDCYDNNACTQATRYVGGCTTPYYTDCINNGNYINSCCEPLNKADCIDHYTTTYSSSYVGNIEAPRFPIIRSAKNCDEDQPGTSKDCNDTQYSSKIDRPTNTATMVDTGNTCSMQVDKFTPAKKLYTVDESTGGDSIMSSLMSIVKNRRNSRNKFQKTKHQNMNSIDNNTSQSYKLIPPYDIENSSNSKSDSKLSLKSNEPKSRRASNPIYKEVKEWVREIPMYPGLEKEAKDKNTTVINDLVKNLYTLAGEAGSPRYDEKVRNEIETCLSKIPLWYPGAKRDQSGFKRELVENLNQRIKNLNRRNAGTNYSKRKSSRNVVTEVHTSLTSCTQSFCNQFQNDPKDVEIKICIIDWLRLIYSKTKNNNVLKNQIFLLADFVTFRINSLLNKPISKSNQNIILKTAILNIMNDLPIVIDCSINTDFHTEDLAEDLANRILSIESKYFNSCNHSIFLTGSNCNNKNSCHSHKEAVMCSEIRKCFDDARVDCNSTVIEEASTILHNCYKMPGTEEKRHAKNEMMNLLVTSTNLSEAQAWNLAKIIIKKVRKVFNEEEVCTSSQTCNSQLQQPFVTSVYTSVEEPSPLAYHVTSTPKKKRAKKEIPKLSPQEVQYIDQVANLIRTWLNTLPENFSALLADKNFKETMINDLAGDIMDEAKLEQLAPDPTKDKREVRKYIVCRWMFKLGASQFQEVDENIETFLNQLQEIQVPTMTQPQRGNRQAMENMKFYEGANWVDNFIPKGTDVLEDEISIWMHEQPSNIFTNNDQKFKQDKIHELAQVLGNKSGKKRSQKEVSKDISKWLSPIVRPEKIPEISELTDKLKDRVIALPQDATLAGIVENRTKIREEQKKSRLENANLPKIYTTNSKDNESADLENTMAIFISKFIEHHYDIDDPLARRAYNRLLNSHLLSLNPPTRKEVYENFENNIYDKKFPPRQVLKELEYIKDISDWLKNLPIDVSYNTLGNSERIDFVNSLALSIREVEEDRQNNPCAMDYDVYMRVMILEHLKLLPIPKVYLENTPFMADQLFNKIIAHRQAVADTIKANESINSSGVNADNIGDFIEEFIKVNSDDIAQDELKMEAWAIRLIREIKKIVPNTCHPSVLSKAEVYNKLADIPIPSDETVKLFNLELDYVKEISNWMKNLPLLPMNDSEKDKVTKKMCNLAEKMVETDRKKLDSPNDEKIDTDFKEYVAKWISELSLSPKHQIVLPVIIQQLINRMKKLEQNNDPPEIKKTETATNKNVKTKKSKGSLSKLGKKNQELTSNDLTEAIEKWSSALPIKAENDDATTSLKNNIAGKIFQEIVQLNINPTVNSDDILFKDQLEDRISSILEIAPQNDEFQNKKDKLNEDIVKTIVEIKNDIKEKTAGNTYKQELEKTIDTSIPTPIPCNQVFDPGFEIYKERLATAFILENFDHGTDVVKTKYETLLKKEIDKYFNHARNRNATPLSKDQLYNELYCALFKVSIPNEASVKDEVEKIKTRCEIDVWFEELPMREANDLNELLDWDKILSSLATRIHEIEISESKQETKISKEIMKWLSKLPLKPGNENKLEEFAMALQKRLKSSVDQRKCVLDSSKSKSKKDKAKVKTKVLAKKSKESQIAGPSSSGKMWTTLNQTHNTPERKNPRKNPADEIYDTVHTWCNQLHINDDPEKMQIIKDDLTTKIIIKLSELNGNSEIFNDDVLYDELLSNELEILLATTPTTCDFNNTKEARIQQLKEKIMSVKPQIAEERDTYKYKQNLANNIDEILDRPQNVPSDKEAYFDGVKNDIIDDFIQYKYSNDDDESKQVHKMNLQDNISRYTTLNAKTNTNDIKKDPKNSVLMKTNQLISELSKLSPKTNKILNYEVEKIRLKNDIAAFFDEIGMPKKDVSKINYLKESLAKKLYDIEINGYNPENENKMKQVVLRYLKKLGKDKNPAIIDAFVTKLKNSEMTRRMPKEMATDTSEFTERVCSRLCPSKERNLRNEISNPPVNFEQIPTCLPTNYSRQYHNSKPQETKGITYQQRCADNHNSDREYISNEDEAAIISDENESSSDDEDMRICLCKKKYGNRHKRRPYCMVPMRYVCEGRDVLNSLWCGVPLPLF